MHGRGKAVSRVSALDSTPDKAVRVQALAWDTVLYSVQYINNTILYSRDKKNNNVT